MTELSPDGDPGARLRRGWPLFALCTVLGAVLLLQWPLQAWRDYRVLRRYQSATCQVLSTRAVRSSTKSYLQGGWITREVSFPEVTFTYRLPDGSHTVTGFDSYDGRTSNASVLVEFREGEGVPCWYDPADPGRAVVARSFSWEYYASGLIPLLLTVIPGNFLILALRRPSPTAAVASQSRASSDLTPAQGRAATIVLAVLGAGILLAYCIHTVRQDGWLGPLTNPFLFFILLLGAAEVHLLPRLWKNSGAARRPTRKARKSQH
jgi:hypothetical protein